MGNPVSLYWLNNYVDQTWKDTYIRYFVSVSPPWGGKWFKIKFFIFFATYRKYLIHLTVELFECWLLLHPSFRFLKS